MQYEVLKSLLNKTLSIKDLIDFLKNKIGGEGDESIIDDTFFYTIDEYNEIKIKFTKENICYEKIKIISVEIIKLD
ncbi:TPA: hypothetical protein ACOTG0_002116 [Clostridium perfringens]|nr:hypothetical protein phiCPD_00029 [Clostridium phage phiCp-D]